ncbi:hypothetical protein HZB60_08840 [candidate division KSB1 bacterium]|nr:hypothetical protein [candidate division KSB1 bacterium]
MPHSSKIFAIPSLVAALMAVALLGCSKREITDGTVVSILYTSDVRGKVEGCGCKHNGGGITKRSAKIKLIRAEDASAVYCDAGNWATGTPAADSSKGMLSVATYNQMATSVVNVSERELAFGYDAFRSARKDSKFAYVSANLKVGGSAVADPYIVKEVKEARVAFIGLCGTRDVMRFDSLKLPADATVEDPLTAARRNVAALLDEVDLIILLSTCGDAVDSSLAAALPQIALIVGGRSYRPNSDAPWVVGNTRVVRAARDGRSMGRMDMVFGPDRKIKMYNPTTITMEVGDPSDDVMLAVVRKFIPKFIDNPTDGVRIEPADVSVASSKPSE